MALAAYAQSRPLHDLGATPRAAEVASVAYEGLQGATHANAMRYAKGAADSALAALLQGDKALSLTHLRRAQRWEAYAKVLTPALEA